MSVVVSDIVSLIEEHAPFGLACEWDNVGLLLGDEKSEVLKVLVALDVSCEALNEAIEMKADLIVTHHPLIFKPIKNITAQNILGNKILSMIKNGISLVSAHTNFDIATGGINDILCDIIGMQADGVIKPSKLTPNEGIGRIGNILRPQRLDMFAKKIANTLGLESVAVYGSHDAVVSRAAVCSGSGMSYAKEIKNADVYVTSDITYHDALDAVEAGLNLIDITHFAGENIFCNHVANIIKERFGGLEVVCSTRHKQPQTILHVNN